MPYYPERIPMPPELAQLLADFPNGVSVEHFSTETGEYSRIRRLPPLKEPTFLPDKSTKP